MKLELLGRGVLKSSAAGMRHALLGTTALIAVGAAAIVSAGDAKAETWTGGGGSGGGSWASGNWAGAMPNGIDAVATFNESDPTPAGWAGIDLSGGPFWVGTLNLNATAGAIAAHSGFQFKSGQLIMQASTGSAAINVQSSSSDYDMQANLQLNSNTVITTASTAASFQISGIVGGAGSVTIAGPGAVSFAGLNSYTGGTIVNDGVLLVSGGTLGNTANSLAVNGGLLVLGFTTQTQNGGITQTGGTIQSGGLKTTTYQMTGGTLDSSATVNASTAFDMRAGTVNGILAGSGGLTKTTDGVVTLAGVNTYTGATTVNGGTLEVDGSIGPSSTALTVNAGGTLSGTGGLGSTTIMSGGTLAPGNAASPTGRLDIGGNLVLQSGAAYLVQVTPSAAANTHVSGMATLGGATVNAVFANGSYIEKKYNILTASAGVSDTFASTVVNTNLPANFKTGLSYDAKNAYLNLTLNYTSPPESGSAAPGYGSGLSRNQQAVGNAFINSFNSNGGIPLVYGALNGAGLTQASGELGTSAQQGTFVAMGQFMGLLTDPSAGRIGAPGTTSGATGFADEEGASAYAAQKQKATDAFAMFTKAPPRSFEPRWSVWAEGFGGSQSTNGNAVTGSNNTTSSIYGSAVGADYLVAPNTLAGFALAGAGTNFSVSGGLGSGRSDLFQAGVYVRHSSGPAYVSAALAYGWQDITTNRSVTIAGVDRLRAEFNANAYSGRLEGGYRVVAPWTNGIGLTPYAAAQFTTFDLPGYAEQVISGASTFALSYAAKSVTDTRSELGLRTDKSFAVQDGVLTLRGRVAWAHDFNLDHSVAATFQALPGASFVVNGAAQAADAALTTVSAEMKWTNGWSVAGTFDGEFSNVTRSYAGKGVVRYQW